MKDKFTTSPPEGGPDLDFLKGIVVTDIIDVEAAMRTYNAKYSAYERWDTLFSTREDFHEDFGLSTL